ncbi:beta-aspartyl-peptidase [Peptoclostridium litorale]|uniref:beta-aspartyl-peptidase n=1 Tax=Peptoclostridium litorale TaxID=1557 RepID=UPI000A9DB5B0|nr:beta-aspartyl-peptidase [Peptoclostridium litorale]
MIKIIKNANIYSPENVGAADVLVAGGKIAAVGKNIEASFEGANIEVIDASGKLMIPGLIDRHVHITGGGGEAGFASRTPEIRFSDISASGITTVVGLLGTDGSARNVEQLYAKACALEHEGISTYILTGSYGCPSITITGCVKKDMMFIDKVVGVKIAVSDHRSPHVTKEELTRLAADARVAGMLSGKRGFVHMHMGDGKAGLDMVSGIIRDGDVPIAQFSPTHVNRSSRLFESALEFAKMGGVIDITSSMDGGGDTIRASEAARLALESGVSPENITMSSDSNGSIPEYDDKGRLKSIGVAGIDSMRTELCDMVKNHSIPVETALKFVTSNPARAIGAGHKKGKIANGYDADIVIVDEDFNVEMVMAKGEKLVESGKCVKKGFFE